MRPRKLRRRLLPVTAAVLIASGLLIGVIPATAATSQPRASDDGNQCIGLNFIEPTIKVYGNMTITSPSALPTGFLAIYFDQLNNPADGTKAGDSAGHFDIMYQLANGDDIEYISESMQLADGTLAGAGSFDRSNMLAGDWINIPVHGTSGRYVGMSGIWHWRVLSFSPPYPVQDKAIVCEGSPVS